MKLSKSILFVLLGNAVFAQNEAFIIAGKITQPNAAGTKVFLQYVNDRGTPINIDSMKVGADNAFKLKGKVSNGGGFYIVDVAHKQKIQLLLDGGENINVLADGNDNLTGGKRGTWSAKGSVNADFLSKLEALNYEMFNKVTAWNKAGTEAQKKNDNAAQKKIQADFEASRGEFSNKVRAMIPAMGDNTVALFATNFLWLSSKPEDEVPLLSELADKVLKAHPNNTVAKSFYQNVLRLKGVAVGTEAPEIALKTPQDSILKLSSLRGKYVLLDFWASWCGPCRQENPNVLRVYAKYKTKGFDIYSVSLDQEKAPWVQAIEKDNLMWHHVSDLQYFNSTAALTYGVNAIPATFLIDPQGKVIAKNLRGEALEQKLAEILGN
jgi:peroxiredoxin